MPRKGMLKKQTKSSLGGGILRGSQKSEVGRDFKDSPIHTLRLTDEVFEAKRWPPSVIEGENGGMGIRPAVLSPNPALFSTVYKQQTLSLVPLCQQ